MARACSQPPKFKHHETDDVEKSLEVLDKVLSEFEDPDSLSPMAVEPDSPSQGHQSEDDGYMSMNGRRAKFSPGFQPTDESFPVAAAAVDKSVVEIPLTKSTTAVVLQQEEKENPLSKTTTVLIESVLPIDKKSLPPSPEEAERIISNFLPRCSPSNTIKSGNKIGNSNNELNDIDCCREMNTIDIRPDNKIFTSNKIAQIKMNPLSVRDTIVNSVELMPSQTTLPKARPSTVIPSRYASLPCSSPPRLLIGGNMPSSSFDDTRSIGTGATVGFTENGDGAPGRAVLGIGISAVHDAVLRGVARIPESIVNEHPVTIYPGRASPTKRVPPRTLAGSIERHREVCRINNPNELLNNSELNTSKENLVYHHHSSAYPGGQQQSSSSSPSSSPPLPPSLLLSGVNEHRSPSLKLNIIRKISPSNKIIMSQYTPPLSSPSSPQINSIQPSFKELLTSSSATPPPLLSPTIIKQISTQLSPTHFHNQNNNFTDWNQINPSITGNSIHRLHPQQQQQQQQQHQSSMLNRKSDCEDFSDDSLEGVSLPPPPPPPIVPPPPSLSAPVTPSKRGSIAWEINLDDLPTQQQQFPNRKQLSSIFAMSGSRSTEKLTPKRRTQSMSGSQSSLLSTSETSAGSTDCRSAEWPDPPEMPICSTEDEAASIYSDSDDLIPYANQIKGSGHGTYIIRKGRKERHRISEFEQLLATAAAAATTTAATTSMNTSEAGTVLPSQKLINDDHLVKTNSKFVSSIGLPFSRHSIDLGSAASDIPVSNQQYQHHHYNNHISSHNHNPPPRSRLSLDLSSPTSELPMHLYHNHPHHQQQIDGIVSTAPTTVTTPASVPTATTTAITNNPNSEQKILSPRYNEFKMYNSTFDALQALDTHNQHNRQNAHHHNSNNNLMNCSSGDGGSVNNINGNSSLPLMRVASLPTISPAHSGEKISTPRRELAPPIEEDEEQDSESQRGAPLRQIENNISALLRGDIIVARVGDIVPPRRPLGFRPGVHKSESAKEMLLSQNTFGPLPPSPPSSSPEEIDGFPPLPPSPEHSNETADFVDVVNGINTMSLSSTHSKHKTDSKYGRDSGGTVDRPPAVPPHRSGSCGPPSGPSINTLKTRSMDAGFSNSYRNSNGLYTSPHYPSHNGGSHDVVVHGSTTRRRYISGAFPKRAAQSPREERRLQTSCSLPETPIFARGCDVPRTPHRRAPELPGPNPPPLPGSSRTAPRQSQAVGSVIGIGSSISNRQRSISQALAGSEMLRLSGGPARGWYPRQRHPRPASTENLDHLNPQGSIRAWDTGTGSRKPLTLPPNFTPKFFNKSPREALRRVTSLLIRKGNGGGKESKKDKDVSIHQAVNRSPGTSGEQQPNTPHKKKGFFKSFWKKSKHYSLEQ